MKTCTVAELIEMQGMQIPRVLVTLKLLWDVQQGTGANGPWSRQSGILKDQTGEVRVTFWNRVLPAEAVGSSIVIRSGKSKRDGSLCGVRMEADKKGTPCLSVKETAIVCPKADEPEQEAPTPAPTPAQNAPQTRWEAPPACPAAAPAPAPAPAPAAGGWGAKPAQPKPAAAQQHAAASSTRVPLAVRVTELAEIIGLCYQAAQVATAGDKEKAQPFASLMAIQLLKEGYRPEKLPQAPPPPPDMDEPDATTHGEPPGDAF